MPLELPGPPVDDWNLQQKLDAIRLQFPAQARFFEPIRTSLPTTGQDGQVIVYQADATNGVNWLLRYRSGSSSAYKWEFIGGAPMSNEVVTSETTSSTTFVDLATVGPSVTAPLAGNYVVRWGCAAKNAAGNFQEAGVKIGAGAIGADDSVYNAGTNDFSLMRERNFTVPSASTVVKVQYKSNAATVATFLRRFLFVVPVRVG